LIAELAVLSTSRVGAVLIHVATAGRTDLSFPAYQDEARSVAAVKEGDEGATAKRRFYVLDCCVSEGRRGWSRKGLALDVPSLGSEKLRWLRAS